MNHTKDYIEKLALAMKVIGHVGSQEQFLLTHGMEFTSDGIIPSKLRMGRMKECFRNSATVSVEWEDLCYCEGLAYRPGLIPVLHAWLVNSKGNVIDLTWKDAKDCEYYGVPFLRRYVLRSMCESGYYGVIDNHPYKLVRGLVKPEEFFNQSVADKINKHKTKGTK